MSNVKGAYEAVTMTLRVRYAETDQMGVVHHSNYLVWFEAARSEYCRKQGIPYNEMEVDGIRLPIVEARCRYRRPARYDEEVTIEVRPTAVTRRLVRFAYRVLRDGEVLAEGETTQMPTGPNGRPCTLPEGIAARFAGIEQSEA